MEEEGTQAPFNMGQATLESIRNLIDQIARLSITATEVPIQERGNVQFAKYVSVKQLAILSTPLLKKEQKEKVMGGFYKIKLQPGSFPQGRGNQNKLGTVYNFQVENELDLMVILIQEELQSTGHFMPSEEEEEDEE